MGYSEETNNIVEYNTSGELERMSIDQLAKLHKQRRIEVLSHQYWEDRPGALELQNIGRILKKKRTAQTKSMK